MLILDDSTSAVDTKTDALIREGLKTYLPEATKIIIAQRVSSVQDADRILVLDNGHVAGLGTHEQLLESCPFYRDTYLAQNRTSQDAGEKGADTEKDTALPATPVKGGEANGR